MCLPLNHKFKVLNCTPMKLTSSIDNRITGVYTNVSFICVKCGKIKTKRINNVILSIEDFD